MARSRWGLSGFIHRRSMKNHRPGYVLLATIIVLLVVTSIIIYQYHYYAGYHRLEGQLYDEYCEKITNNLREARRGPVLNLP